MNYNVPFVPNTSDDLHCLQAAYWMILKYFRPDFHIDWDEFSALTGFEQRKGSWSTAGMLWFASKGFKVKYITRFDFEQFIKDGERYLGEYAGAEIGEWEVEHANIPEEVERAKILVTTTIWEKREPTVDDIKGYLNEGYLVECLVNSRRLNGREGYFGHSVVVKGYDAGHLIIHDPGPPSKQDWKIKLADFEAAWADPDPSFKEMSIIKL